MKLTTPIKELSGVGKTREAALKKLGIHTVRDLIYFFPRAYENRGDIHELGEHLLDAPKSYILTVACEVSNVKLKNRLTMSKFRAFDDSGTVEVIFFNSPFVKDIFHIGSVFRFYGKPSFSKAKRLNLINPKYEPVVEGVPLPDLVPIYPMTEGVTAKLLNKLLKDVINDTLPLIEDFLPESIRLKHNLPTLSLALRAIHFPNDNNELLRAQRRLAFDEMLFFALGISLSGAQRTVTEGIPFKPSSIKPLTDLLPYELTNSQKQAINDIYRDTVIKKADGKTPAMARIIVGDVGCGKTVCAAAAIYFAKMSGVQSALMVPTEILANQHFDVISRLFAPLGIRVELLCGSASQKEKRRIYSELRDGTIDVIIGTHALITDKVEFSRLGLIITDEQHRFGVAQRAVLKDRSKNAHMLVMSATPIPRTLALALYGDLDISRITEMPKGRMKVDTFVVNEEYRTRLNSFIEKQVAIGGQCYIVCPSIEKSEDEIGGIISEGLSPGAFVDTDRLKLKNAVDYAEDLKKALPKLKIAVLHGRMKNAEKDEVMNAFAKGEIDVLVSTTVIEVGVNVPNASLMIVENAERFGLSQLHQLRGRVGRGTRKSYCVLVSDINSEKSRARLEVMRTTYDGFEIADKDLMLRGPGDFFSSNSDYSLRQSGGFEFKLAKLCDDNTLFEAAFSSAKGIVNIDRDLSLEEHKGLKESLDYLIYPPSVIS